MHIDVDFSELGRSRNFQKELTPGQQSQLGLGVSDTFVIVLRIAPIWDLVWVHGWPGEDGRGCDTPRPGKGTSPGGVLPNQCFYLIITSNIWDTCMNRNKYGSLTK
jgi:hypothetical protein